MLCWSIVIGDCHYLLIAKVATSTGVCDSAETLLWLPSAKTRLNGTRRGFMPD